MSQAPNLPPMSPDVGVLIQNISAKWTDDGPITLNNINIAVPKGKLCAIIGSVGSGKVTQRPLSRTFHVHNHFKLVGKNFRLFLELRAAIVVKRVTSNERTHQLVRAAVLRQPGAVAVRRHCTTKHTVWTTVQFQEVQGGNILI